MPNERLILPLLLLAFCASPVFAQTTIRGFVTEARSEEPLQGANVVVRIPDGRVRGTVTDGDGFFRLGGLPAATVRVTISFVGFRPYEDDVDASRGGTVTLRVALEEGGEALEEVVVEAEAETGVTAVTAGLEAIRPKDVARVPVPGASGDLAAYVQSVPGVVLQGDRGGRYHVRGGADDQNLVLLEGIPVYGAYHILSLYSAFPEDVIDRADFYTAAFGAAYGERLSSMLDVRARNGNKQAPGGAVALSPFLSGAVVEGPILPGRVSVLLSGRRSLVSDLTPSLFGQKMPYRFGDAFGKIHALLGAGQSLSIFGLLTDDEGQMAGTQYTFEGDAISVPATDSLDLRWDNRMIGGTYRIEPGRRPIRLSFTAGYSRYASSFGPAGREERESGLESLDMRMDGEIQVAGLPVSFGALRRATDVTYRLDEPFRDVPASLDRRLVEWAGYVGVAPVFGGFAVEPGVRVYRNGRTVFEPRVRATLKLPVTGGTQRLTAAWARTHQSLVGLSDERDVGNPFAIWTVSEGETPRATHAVVGWNGTVYGRSIMAVELFRKRYEGLLVPVFTSYPSFTTSLQPADGTARGIDVRLSLEDAPFWFESRLGGWVSYAYTRVRYTTGSGVTYPPAQDRRHSVQGMFFARKNEITVSVQAQVASGLPYTPSSGFDVWYPFTPDVDVSSDPGRTRILYGAPNSARLPTYARVDLWIERRIDRGRTVATLRAGALNAFNRSNLFYFDLFTFRRVDQLPFVPSVGVKLEVR